MRTHVVPQVDPDALASAVAELAAERDVQTILLLGCSADAWDPAALARVLAAASIPLVGGLFPGIVVDGSVREHGTLLIGLPVSAQVVTAPLGAPAPAQRAWLERHLPQVASDQGTALVLADAAEGGIATLVHALHDLLGPTWSYLGGGTGHRDLTPGPTVVAGGQLRSGVAAVALLDAPSTVAVAHGWSPLGRHLPVTRSDGRTIELLDGQPAARIYREVVRGHAGEAVASAPIEQLGRWYPLGISRVGDEPVVRDLVAEVGDGVRCIAEVPQGCYVRVLHGDHAALLAGAEQVTVGLSDPFAGARPPGGRRGQPLLFDCISRVLHLGDRYTEELELVTADGPVVGALTIGEVAGTPHRAPDFHNKTIVLGQVGVDG